MSKSRRDLELAIKELTKRNMEKSLSLFAQHCWHIVENLEDNDAVFETGQALVQAMHHVQALVRQSSGLVVYLS